MIRYAIIAATLSLACGAPQNASAPQSEAPAPSVSAAAAEPPEDESSSDPWLHREVVVTNDGELYSTINTIDCLVWPSETIRTLAGSGSWGSGFYPRNGMRGVVVGVSKHCDQDRLVAIVQIGEHYAPIGVLGLKLTDGKPRRATARTTTGKVKLTDLGKVYTTINQSSCLAWPDDQVQILAGSSAWKSMGYKPAIGDVGVVIWSTVHCNHRDRVLIVRVNGAYVPVDERGVTPVP